MSGRLRRLDADLWIAETPLRFAGVEVGARMTVVRLPGPALMLHSPTPAAPDLVREVEALGPVRFVVAPNCFHHLYVSEWQAACPDADIYVAPGLGAKRSDLRGARVLGERPEPGWIGTLEQTPLDGLPLLNETVFFHRPSATLIATDLAFNIGPESPALTRIAFGLVGRRGELAPTLLERLLVRDRAAFSRSLERILEWPFERVVIAHGEVSEAGGREQLTRNYAWALQAASAR